MMSSSRFALFAVALALSPAVSFAADALESDAQTADEPGSLSVQEPDAGTGDFDQFDGEFGSTEAVKAPFDPLRGYNRVMFKVNDKIYFWLVKPVAKGYGWVVPEGARAAVSRAYANMRFPLRFANTLLQLKLKRSGTELGRFLVNSTVGLGGLFDPADRRLHWLPSEEDFGQTLGHYGVGDGFPLVLPVFGQTNLRDGVGLVPNVWVNPLTYVANFETTLGVAAGEQFNYASLHLGEYESVKADALDPYTFIRDAYKQNRDNKIKE